VSAVRRVALAAPLLALLAVAGCETPYLTARVDVGDTTVPYLPAPVPAPPVPAAAPPMAATGSLFQAAAYRPLFETHRARTVGDTLLVQITEKVSATQKATSSIDKSGSLEAGVSALPGFNANSFGRATASGSGAQAFSGEGTTASSNDFSGTITAIVTGVLPNGHLAIAGEKQVGVNHNVEVLRFSGIVDPRAIQPGNSIASTQIANVRVEHRGRGPMADAQGIGWLARYFLNLLPI
jgi:flagellar L-ring protein FlgH